MHLHTAIDVCSSFSARIVVPVLVRYLRKEHSVFLMKRKRAFSGH